MVSHLVDDCMAVDDSLLPKLEQYATLRGGLEKDEAGALVSRVAVVLKHHIRLETVQRHEGSRFESFCGSPPDFSLTESPV